MATIVAGGCADYGLSPLRELFASALADFSESFEGCKVLLKPNLLSGKPTDRAVNTHPLFVQALAEVFIEKKCTVFVGDSPGYESTERALRKSGIMEVVHRLRLRVATFEKRVRKANSGISPYREFFFGEEPRDYDLVVNMPKLKSHVLMGLTAGVKNTFGFVPSLEKAKWHLRCGTDKRLFASLLIDINAVVKPGLTVLDGIVAMDGGGPSHGRVRKLGLVVLSDDDLALDAYLEKVLSISSPLPVSLAARDNGLLRESTLIDRGVPRIGSFLVPDGTQAPWNVPHFVTEAARRAFTKKPKWDPRNCTSCGTCSDVCASRALTLADETVSFDFRKCIRCYCCAEMCPVGAITV
jgi:uncharacterized protein (DUF362 family)/Pyruvate/2-oxoacid:ferredoxin oxidoreductase delta subunit